MSFISRFFLLVLFLSFGELYLLMLVAEHITLITTLALCVLTGILGGAMVRIQGLQTLRDIQGSLAKGQAPADAAFQDQRRRRDLSDAAAQRDGINRF